MNNGDTKELNNKMFNDRRTATRMCAVRNQADMSTSMHCISVKSTRFYEIYTIYRNYRLYGSSDKINILDLNDTPKLIHVANSIEDALDYIDNLLK